MSDHEREVEDDQVEPEGSPSGDGSVGQSGDTPHVRSWREGAWRYWTQGRARGTLEDYLAVDDYFGGHPEPGPLRRPPLDVPPSVEDSASDVPPIAPRDASEEDVADAPVVDRAVVDEAAAPVEDERAAAESVAAAVEEDRPPSEPERDGEGGVSAASVGETLADRIHRLRGDRGVRSIGRPTSRDEVLWMARVLADALDRLHEIHLTGRIHGAITPGRLVITSNEAAVLLDPEFPTEEPPGAYAAPDAVAAKAGSDPVARHDVWSMGACLFEALTWQRPFEDAHAAAEAAFRGEAIPIPHRLNAAIPRPISRVVRRAIEPNPAQRYATAAAFAADLDAARRGVAPRWVGGGSSPTTSSRGLAATFLFVLVLVAGGIWLLRQDALGVRSERNHLLAELTSARARIGVVSGNLEEEVASRREVTTAYSPDGSRLVALFDGGASASLCTTPGGAPEAYTRLVGHEGPINAATFDPSGTRLLTASADGTAALWDVKTGARSLRLVGHGGEVMTAEWSGDGTRIVTSSLDGTARVWDATSGKQLQVLKNPGAVRMARFSPSARHVLTLTGAGKVVIFDLATGKLLATIDGPPPPLL